MSTGGLRLFSDIGWPYGWSQERTFNASWRQQPAHARDSWLKPMLLMVEQPVGVLKSKSGPKLPFLINKPNGGFPANSREEAGFAFKGIVLIE